MKNTNPDLSRGEKILLFLYDYGKGKRVKVRYEDIVVGVFKKYPGCFQLKGYPEYPDSGDLIHKPLYDFKKKGYVDAANKIFSLTERGVEFAEQISKKKHGTTDNERLSRSASVEVARIKSLEGFSLFLNGEADKLSENDFYNYLSVTVRTNKNAFIGRLESMKALIKEIENQKADPLYDQIVKYHNLLTSKYQNVTEFFLKN